MGKALEKPHSQDKPFYTAEEYFALAAASKEGERYEYYRGTIITCEEYTTTDHNQVVINACNILQAHFYPKGCRVYTENVRLQVADKTEYRLPDIIATCSERDKMNKSGVSDPVVLVEVLSLGTALNDLAVKADSYRTIESPQVYLIINPAEIWVRVYEKNDQGKWLPDVSYHQLTDMISLTQIGLQISATELYCFVF